MNKILPTEFTTEHLDTTDEDTHLREAETIQELLQEMKPHLDEAGKDLLQPRWETVVQIVDRLAK